MAKETLSVPGSSPSSLQLHQNRAIRHAIGLLPGRGKVILSLAGFQMVEVPR